MRNAAHGHNASSLIVTTIAIPTAAVMCSPLTDNRCASPALRIASASGSAIAPTSPVAKAAAMPPALPGNRLMICADSRARTRPAAGSLSSTTTGPRLRPIAPMPLNHAARAAS